MFHCSTLFCTTAAVIAEVVDWSCVLNFHSPPLYFLFGLCVFVGRRSLCMLYDLHDLLITLLLGFFCSRFIPARDSPNGKPLLLVTGSRSGTITVVQVNVYGVGSLNGEPSV